MRTDMKFMPAQVFISGARLGYLCLHDVGVMRNFHFGVPFHAGMKSHTGMKMG